MHPSTTSNGIVFTVLAMQDFLLKKHGIRTTKQVGFISQCFIHTHAWGTWNTIPLLENFPPRPPCSHCPPRKCLGGIYICLPAVHTHAYWGTWKLKIIGLLISLLAPPLLSATPGTVPGGSDDPKVHRLPSPLVQRRGRGHRETERVSGRTGEEGLAGEQGGTGGRDKGLVLALLLFFLL